ncbi:hypothetical protein KUA23_23115 [Pseudomonas pergaminensis]|uniref:SMODS-associating 2TM beta-strand rich effector domain-containing protein n=1 Tax=Pseudomonas pergaminensis TaxID=2853159 RepID=A0ABD7TE43_9PSED|nr:hypothetical protein [Pseudomonas pergaminensis]USV99890.1 hypothetical protein KUA23_23115 [Pseudomonas pergaminensis]
MRHLDKINITLALLLSFLIGSLFGLSVELGWGLPLGTSLTLVIATLGFGVTLYQSHSTRRHNRLLVRPHLILSLPFSSIEIDGFYSFSVKVKNSGLGPALIEKFSISIGKDGDIPSGSLLETIQKHAREQFNAKGNTRCGSNYLREGNAIDKGEEKTILEINFRKEKIIFSEARELAKLYSSTIAIKIHYHCHYGNKFKLNKLASQNKNLKPDLTDIT